MQLSANCQGFKLLTMKNLDVVTVTKPQSLIDEIKVLIKDAEKNIKNNILWEILCVKM